MSITRSYTIHLATDHAGFTHKEAVRSWLLDEGFEVVDHGARAVDPEDDYPDFIALAAAAISKNPESSRGIIFGGSGQGEAMLANRFLHVRAAVYYGGADDIISLSRKHNDSNVLSIGARFVSIDDTKRVIWKWLSTDPLKDEKYHRRNQKITALTRTLHGKASQ